MQTTKSNLTCSATVGETVFSQDINRFAGLATHSALGFLKGSAQLVNILVDSLLGIHTERVSHSCFDNRFFVYRADSSMKMLRSVEKWLVPFKTSQGIDLQSFHTWPTALALVA